MDGRAVPIALPRARATDPASAPNASWEGFVLEKTLAEANPDQAYFWGTHAGAELDLMLWTRGRRIGVEIKRVDAPRRTPSMTAALRDLSLDALYVLYPAELRYEIGERITAVPTAERFSLEAPA